MNSKYVDSTCYRALLPLLLVLTLSCMAPQVTLKDGAPFKLGKWSACFIVWIMVVSACLVFLSAPNSYATQGAAAAATVQKHVRDSRPTQGFRANDGWPKGNAGYASVQIWPYASACSGTMRIRISPVQSRPPLRYCYCCYSCFLFFLKV